MHMAKWISSHLFKLFGWKVDGLKPTLKKYVIIVAPHTSNWDFFVGWTARSVIGFHSSFLAKKELFEIPFVGWFLKLIGGVPVDRRKKSNLVDEVVSLYKRRKEFIMTITPEGTRSYSSEWKTGFYRIAHQAGVPIVKIAFDYPTKTVHIDTPFYPSGDLNKEVEEIKSYYKQFTGKHPDYGVR